MAQPEISTSGAIEFILKGTSAEGQASGLFDKGDVLIDYNVTLTSGPWTAVVSPEFDIGGGALAECDAYMTYSAEAFTLTLDPTGIDNSIYDVEGAAGCPGIPSHAGLKLEVPFGSSFYLILNNTADGEDVVYNFAGGADFSMGGIDLGVTFNSNGEETDTWYGSSYALKVGYALDALSFLVEYGAFSPSTDGLESGAGYYVEMGYSLAGGGAFTVSYTGVDENMNSADGTDRDAYSKIYAEYTMPIAENVNLTFDVASTDDGSGGDTVTDWEGKIGISF